MTWARLDDMFPWNRKIRRLSDAAFRVHTTGIVACARDLTDGLIRQDDIDDFPPQRTLDKGLRELVDRGLWEVVEGGWRIHDYLDYNPSKVDVEAERAAARERQRKRRLARAGVTDEPDVTRDSRVTHGVVTRESQTPSQPVPTRPTRPVPTRPDVGVLHVVGDGDQVQDRPVGDGARSSSLGLGGDL